MKDDTQQTDRVRASGPRQSFRAGPAMVFLAAVFLLAVVGGQGRALAQTSPQTQDNSAAAPAPAAPATTMPTPMSAPTASAPATSAPATNAPASGAPTTSTSNTPAASAPAPNAPATGAESPTAQAAPAAAPVTMGGAQLQDDLSPWGMFLNADIVVKIVMMGLLLASVITWTVFFAKTLELRGARSQARRDLGVLNEATTIAQAHEQLRDGKSAVAVLMQSAAQEIRLSATLRAEGLKERIALQLERIEMSVSRKVSRGTGILATIGSTAPFVGLFGTVWGIMNSFIGISNAHTTNLAVVAPGIAQALLATAFGLVAAIPAVVVYNVLARQTQQYRALLGDASAQVMRLVSRDLDRAKLPLSQAAE